MKNSLFKTVASSALAALAATQITGPVSADTYTSTSSSGSFLTVDKKVATMGNGSTFASRTYVDNIATSDTHYGAGDAIFFKITVKNTSDKTMDSVIVRDTLPSELAYADGSNIAKLSGKDALIELGSLVAGEEKTVYIKTGTTGINPGTTCATNKAYAKGSINNVLQEDNDSAQVCIDNGTGKRVIGITTIPKTGPEAGIALAIGQLALLAGGLKLRKWA